MVRKSVTRKFGWRKIGWNSDFWALWPMPSHTTASSHPIMPLPTRVTAPAHPPATTFWPCIRLCFHEKGVDLGYGIKGRQDFWWKIIQEGKRFSSLLSLVYGEHEKGPRSLWSLSCCHIYQVSSCGLNFLILNFLKVSWTRPDIQAKTVRLALSILRPISSLCPQPHLEL